MGKIEEALEVLKHMGLPRAQQNERSALTLLAVVDLSPRASWSAAKKRIIRIHDILTFIEKEYKKKYAENTRETIRRQTIHQFEQAGLVVRNPDDPTRPTNSPNNVYAVSDEALAVIHCFGTTGWGKALQDFIGAKGKLAERYEKRKTALSLTVEVAKAVNIIFSPGKHNELQIKIISEWRPRFCPSAEVVYVGDTAHKFLHVNEKLLEKLNIPMTEHDKLPDVVLFEKGNNRLLLIEAVTSHGPISPKRYVELEKTLSKCKLTKVYVSAFPDFHEFKRHIDNVAWETEVWLASNPDHMIHFNGPKFFSAY